jgi:hypothetical protein
MNPNNVIYLRKLHFHSRCERYCAFLTYVDLMRLLSVSRPTAYRLMKDRRFSPVQREILELKLFGLIPGWDGWRVGPGELWDPTGYRYSIGDIMSLPLLKSIKIG